MMQWFISRAKIYAMALLACMALLLVLIMADAVWRAALAVDNGQYENVPPNIRSWFDNLKNSQGGSCCSLADGHRLDGDDVDTRGNTWLVFVEDEWWEVPEDRIVWNAGNPVGQAVVFYRVVQRPDQAKRLDIFCFVPPGGV